jgi:glycosyltransferase involved in cell wall biosynthesis
MEFPVTISVLMSVFNTDFNLVKRAIDSVLQQDYQDFELILIDDGTKNDPDNLLLAYAKQHAHKICYLHHANRGQAQSINRGILISNGKYISILDADDEYKPNHLFACLQEMQHADLIASTTHTIVDKDEDYYVPDDCVLFATLFGKKEVFLRTKFQNRYAADAFFYEQAAQHYTVRKVDLRTYVYYRNSPSSICTRLKEKFATELV